MPYNKASCAVKWGSMPRGNPGVPKPGSGNRTEKGFYERKLNPAKIADIRARYQDGEAVKSIMASYAISEGRVRRVCTGIHRARKRLTAQEIRQMLHRYHAKDSGETIEDIARAFGVGPATVVHYCKVSPERRPVLFSHAERAEIRRRYQAGEESKSIADAFPPATMRNVWDICKGIRRRKPDPTNEQIQEMRDRYQAGESQHAIAAFLGFSETTISKHIDDLPKHIKVLTEDEIQEIRQRYQHGEDAPAIAQSFGISASSVWGHTRDLPGRHRLSEEQIREIRERYQNGERPQNIAAVFGITPDRVRDHTRDLRHTVRRNDEQIQEARRRYQRGDTIKDIVRGVGISSETIYRYIDGIPRRIRKLSDADEADIIRRVIQDKESRHAVARHLGIDVARVSRIVSGKDSPKKNKE